MSVGGSASFTNGPVFAVEPPSLTTVCAPPGGLMSEGSASGQRLRELVLVAQDSRGPVFASRSHSKFG